MNSKIKIGWSEIDITPNEKIRLAGQFYERISDEVETPITVTALAIECGGEQAVICSCDIACIHEALVSNVRENLRDNSSGLDVSKILIGATHTHTSYQYSYRHAPKKNSTIDVLKRYIPKDRNYVKHVSGEAMDPHDAFDFLVEKITLAVKTAWENRDLGYYSNAFGRAAIGMCRRVAYDDGSAKMWGDSNMANFSELEGGNDSGIELLYFFDANKKLTGILANIACPAQVVEQRSFISSDYWGKVKIQLREHFGENLFVLGLASPAGDQCPRDLIRWVDPETPIDDPNVTPRKLSRSADPSMYDIAGTWKIGRRIFHEIVDAYDDAICNMKNEDVFIHNVETLDLPLRRATISEYNEADEKLRNFFRDYEGDIDYNDNAHLYVYAGTIIRYELQQTKNIVPIELHTLRLGNVAIANNPFELFLDYANRIRARSSAKQTFLFQMTNGNLGYLPTQKAERAGHYSAYISSGNVGHEGGDLLVRKTLESINKMF